MYAEVSKGTQKNPKYFVGQPIFGTIPIFPDGIYYRFQKGEHLLIYVSPKAASLPFNNSVIGDPAEFAFTLQQNILFFVARFGDSTWCKSRYYWHRTPEDQRCLPQNTKTQDGTSDLHLLLIDNKIGCIQGVRTIAMPQQFTLELHRAINKQASLPAMKKKKYDEIVAQLELKYPQPKDLLSIARARFIDIPSQSHK